MKLFNITVLGLTLAGTFLFFGATKQSFSKDALSKLPVSDTPVVIELFTSQGCSSCPPADRAAEFLTARDNIYVLSCHVTYWDYIGWEDTLAQPVCDQRQRHYSQSFNNGTRVYTPQAIINGSNEMVGSRTSQLLREVERAQKKEIAHISMSFDEEQKLLVDLPALETANAHQLKIFLIKKEEITPIGRGENKDKTITYVQNVMDIYSIRDWDGTQETRKVPLPPHRIRTSKADEIIILANEGEYGAVRAVGRLGL